MTDQPSAYQLWLQADGRTDDFNKQRYRDLLVAHGHKTTADIGTPLPGGWPGRRFRSSRRWLETAHLTADERVAALGPHRWTVPSFEDTEGE